MKRVIVTGATSMIGVALITECIKNNVEVLAIVRGQSTRMSRLPESDLIKTVDCSLDELQRLGNIDEKYDVFYHFAWAYTAKEYREDVVLQEKNIKYTLDAVELAKKLGCRKFVGAGSQAEYGSVEAVISEKTLANPTTAYGIAKNAAGQLSAVLCQKYDMVHIWGRIFSVYGRYDNEGTMLNYAIEKFLKGELPMFSSGTQMWDYLNESDAGKIFFYLGEKVWESKIFRVASGKARPLKTYIEELRNQFGNDAKCIYAKDMNSKSLSLEVDTKDIENAIDFVPKVEFSEGIKSMIQYRKSLLENEGVL